MFASTAAISGFQWPVSVNGYRWHRWRYPLVSPETGFEVLFSGDTALKGPYCHWENHLAPVGDSTETRTPLSEPTRFLDFAYLPCTRHAVIGFAKEYGLLEPPFDDPGRNVELGMPVGEPDYDWYGAISDMRIAVAVWLASIEKTDEELEKLVSDAGSSAEWWPDITATLNEPSRAATRVSRIRHLASRSNARSLAEEWALEALNDWSSPTVTTWQFSSTAPRNRRVLEVVPASLKSALWLQFALAMAQDASYRRCEHCGGFIDTSSVRSSRRYCSNSCRTLAFNVRKAANRP
jgi:hypothetical protein